MLTTQGVALLQRNEVALGIVSTPSAASGTLSWGSDSTAASGSSSRGSAGATRRRALISVGARLITRNKKHDGNYPHPP